MTKPRIKEVDFRDCPKCGIRMEEKGHVGDDATCYQCPKCKNVELLYGC